MNVSLPRLHVCYLLNMEQERQALSWTLSRLVIPCPLTIYVSKIRFNIILSSTPRSIWPLECSARPFYVSNCFIPKSVMCRTVQLSDGYRSNNFSGFSVYSFLLISFFPSPLFLLFFIFYTFHYRFFLFGASIISPLLHVPLVSLFLILLIILTHTVVYSGS
jgi:hypothetical protein